MNDHAASLHDLTDRERFLVRATRHFLRSALHGTRVPEFVVDAFDDAGMDHLYYYLDRIVVCLRAAPTCRITVHDVECPCLAQHEQAFVMALAMLARNDGAGYEAAMTTVMLLSAARVAEPAMGMLATALGRADAAKLRRLLARDRPADGSIRVAPQVGEDKTIN